jgi:hypothetical protein
VGVVFGSCCRRERCSSPAALSSICSLACRPLPGALTRCGRGTRSASEMIDAPQDFHHWRRIWDLWGAHGAPEITRSRFRLAAAIASAISFGGTRDPMATAIPTAVAIIAAMASSYAFRETRAD